MLNILSNYFYYFIYQNFKIVLYNCLDLNLLIV